MPRLPAAGTIHGEGGAVCEKQFSPWDHPLPTTPGRGPGSLPTELTHSVTRELLWNWNPLCICDFCLESKSYPVTGISEVGCHHGEEHTDSTPCPYKAEPAQRSGRPARTRHCPGCYRSTVGKTDSRDPRGSCGKGQTMCLALRRLFLCITLLLKNTIRPEVGQK